MAVLKYIYSLPFDDAGTRLEYVPVAGDINKVARQFYDDSYWVLTSVSPVQWTPMQAVDSNVTGVYKPITRIYEFTAPLIATPGALLIDEEVDLGPFGLLAVTPRMANMCWAIEKPDGQGGWVVTNQSRVGTPAVPLPGGLDPVAAGVPNDDLPGYGVSIETWWSPMARPYATGGDQFDEAFRLASSASNFVGQNAGRDVTAGPGVEIFADAGVNGVGRRRYRLRVAVYRDGTVYTPGEQAAIDALGYRIRVYADAPDFCGWEREVPITGAEGSVLINEELDLSKFGMITDEMRFVFIMSMRRNGKTIRALGAGYQQGEEFDPPCPPVSFFVKGVAPGTPWWNAQNENQFGNGTLRYGEGTTEVGKLGFPNMSLWAGSWTGPETGNCSESAQQVLRVLAWRSAAIPSTYENGAPGTHGIAALMGSMLRATVAGIPGQVIVNGIVEGPLAATFRPGGGVDLYAQTGDTLYNVLDLIDAGSVDSKVMVMARGPNHTFDFVLATYLSLAEAPLTVPALDRVATPGNAGVATTACIRLLLCPPYKLGGYPFLVGAERGVNSLDLYQDEHLPAQGGQEPSGLHIKAGALMLGSSRIVHDTGITHYLGEATGTGVAQQWTTPEYPVPALFKVIPLTWPAGSAVETVVVVTPAASFGSLTYIDVTVTLGVLYRLEFIR